MNTKTITITLVKMMMGSVSGSKSKINKESRHSNRTNRMIYLICLVEFITFITFKASKLIYISFINDWLIISLNNFNEIYKFVKYIQR